MKLVLVSRVLWLTGIEHNDEFYTDDEGNNRTVTNRSGIQGGISNGENIIIRVAFKPTAMIKKEQNTVTKTGESGVLAAKGRHDPCVLPRAVPMVSDCGFSIMRPFIEISGAV